MGGVNAVMASPAASTRARLSPRRRKLWAVAAVFVSVLAFGLLLEAFIRISDRFNWVKLGYYERLPGVNFKLNSRAEGANREGFRDLDRSFEKPPNTYRVLFLGDSFVYGRVPYERNFPTILEQRLNALGPDRQVEIVNLGVPGYGPADSIRLWQHYAWRYDHDAVVLGFYYDNDYTDNDPNFTSLSILGERVLIDKRSWLDKSHLLALLRDRWGLLRFNFTREDAIGESFFTSAEAEKMLLTSLNIHDRGFVWGLTERRRQMKETFQQMQHVAGLRETPIFVVCYPGETLINREQVKEQIRKFGRDPERYDFFQLNRDFGALMEELGIPSYDITLEIEYAAEREAVYIQYDGHWNEAGNRIAAEAMVPAIQSFISANGVRFERKADRLPRALGTGRDSDSGA